MNFKYIISSLFLLFLAFGACTEDERGLETQGYLELGVSKNVEVITRGFDVEDQSLAVDICAGANDSIVKHFSDYNDMAGDRVLLDVGTYKVKVSSNPTSKLEFEQPTFYGEKTNVAVTAGNTTAVSVECFLSCVKVTTEFTKPVQNMFKSVIARISDKSGSYLDYGLKETRAGYFQPGYILVDLTLTNKEGLEFKMSKLIDKTEARDHYHLVFDMIESDGNNSGMDFDITIEDDPTNDETHTVTIPLPETGYGQEPPVVKFVDGEGKEIENNSISFLKGSGAQTMFIKTVSSNIGLQSVTLLSVSSLFENKSIPSSLDLLKLSEDDKTKLSEIGLTIPTLEDAKKEFTVDFSTLLSEHLPGGSHKFTIVSRDVMGHEEVETITVIVKLSTMTMDVVESEVWAHYATLRGFVEGASDSEKESYKFQYKKESEGDDAWQNVSGQVSVLSTSDNANITQVVTGLDDGTKYVYRLVVDDSPADNVAYFTTEVAAQLPNSGFEEWYNDGDGLPKPAKDANNVFWDCGNTNAPIVGNQIMTAQDRNSKVEGESSVKMETKKAPIVNIIAAGNIFTGSFKVDGMGGILTLGRGFYSRPVQLTGSYIYKPARLGDKKDHYTGDMDLCSFYVALTDEQITVNTNTGVYFNPKDDRIIAYGSINDDETKGADDWTVFTVNLEYRDLTRIPKYIIVVASSSKYGDYMEGAEGSIMYLDDLELVYPNSLEEVRQ